MPPLQRSENEAGMQIIGTAAPNGVAAAHLEQMRDQLAADGKQCRLIIDLLTGHVDAATIPEAKLLPSLSKQMMHWLLVSKLDEAMISSGK